MAYNGNPDIPADIDFFVLLMIYIFRLFPCHFYEQLYYYNALYCFCKRKNKKILKTCTVNLNRQHCQKSAAGKNNSFPIHYSRSKHNCVFMKFLDSRTFGSAVNSMFCSELSHKNLSDLTKKRSQTAFFSVTSQRIETWDLKSIIWWCWDKLSSIFRKNLSKN